jgi:hypothetical protein
VVVVARDTDGVDIPDLIARASAIADAFHPALCMA